MGENERYIVELKRGLVVRFFDGCDEDDQCHAVVDAFEVDRSDAFVAAAAILRPILRSRPEIACRSIGSLVALADYRVCENCDGDLTKCSFANIFADETEEH
jgi:hypothetical protein